ncbi:response regulator transcription factor (plasmid) [Devosia neptuniae]|uniref:Response regulator transcription factor n=1 Tax=Devosia neptuniae TaxID=191302 RepID=A0ABY6C7R2_9HYPH|nr:response regulator transcription factor [Devosia neptuniae]UXN67913.1 response regulator transcription factor [Devosia neptuniae]
MASIVIASTDVDYYLLLSHILSEAGFAVRLASSVEETVHLSNEANPFAILLDCRSGDRLAIEACLDLKRDATTFGIPTVALIGPGAEQQYLSLMTAGVDESFVRPITPRKLIGFLERLAGLPITGRTYPDGRATLIYADIDIDLDAHRVSRNGRPIHLGPIEFRMLRHLIEHTGQVCSRDALVEAAWRHGQYVDRRTVNVHVGRLRQALGESGGNIIRTVRSAGYILDAPAQPSRD